MDSAHPAQVIFVSIESVPNSTNDEFSLIYLSVRAAVSSIISTHMLTVLLEQICVLENSYEICLLKNNILYTSIFNK